MEENIKHLKDEMLVDSPAVIQRKLKNVLYSDNYCGLCFEESTELCFDQQMDLVGDFGVHKVVLRDMIAYVFKNEIEHMANTRICIKCIDQIYNAFLFIKKTDINMKMMVKYIDHIDCRAQEVRDLGNQEKLNITVCHHEVNETDNNAKIIVESGFKCCKCETVLNNFNNLKTHEKSHQWKFKVECKICEELVYFKLYNEHLRMKHPDVAYSCPYCYSAYLSKRNYQNHLKRHATNKDLKKIRKKDSSTVEVGRCELCYQQLHKSNYKTHKCKLACFDCDVLQCVHYKYLIACRTQMVNHTVLRCPETPCEYVCKEKSTLIAHLNKKHLDYHPYTCDMCKQEFYSKLLMKKHIIKCHQETYFCNYCCKDFRKEKDSYKSHLVMCQSVERDFKCDDCEASFDMEAELLKHQENCRRYSCESCNLRFSKEINLIKHKKKAHNGLQILGKCPNKTLLGYKSSHIICSECGVLCTEACIELHIQKYHPDIQAKFLCEFCDKTFKNIKSLLLHKQNHTKRVPCHVCSKLVHEGRMTRHLKYHIQQDLALVNGLQCSHCEYRAISMALIEIHINQVHLKIKPYHCELCNKNFCGKADLDKHIVSHTRPQQIICEICSLPLYNNRSYKKHMAKHTGIKPFKCEQCTEGFHSLGELNYHKNRHKGKNISCPMPHCNSKFAVMTNMRSHFRNVHWKQKGEKFDPKLVKGLHERYYHLFEDKRCRKIMED